MTWNNIIPWLLFIWVGTRRRSRGRINWYCVSQASGLVTSLPIREAFSREPLSIAPHDAARFTPRMRAPPNVRIPRSVRIWAGKYKYPDVRRTYSRSTCPRGLVESCVDPWHTLPTVHGLRVTRTLCGHNDLAMPCFGFMSKRVIRIKRGQLIQELLLFLFILCGFGVTAAIKLDNCDRHMLTTGGTQSSPQSPAVDWNWRFFFRVARTSWELILRLICLCGCKLLAPTCNKRASYNLSNSETSNQLNGCSVNNSLEASRSTNRRTVYNKQEYRPKARADFLLRNNSFIDVYGVRLLITNRFCIHFY